LSIPVATGRIFTPVYRLYERLTDTAVTVEKVYHHDAEQRVIDERNDPQADLLLTNSQLALEVVRDSGVFDPYALALKVSSRQEIQDLALDIIEAQQREIGQMRAWRLSWSQAGASATPPSKPATETDKPSHMVPGEDMNH
jgi:Domain of unknown function (DUF305)